MRIWARMMLIAALAGCATNTGTIPLGRETSAPAGWTAYCAEHPARAECR